MSAIAHPTIHQTMPTPTSPQLDELMLFGFFSGFLAMVLFLHRHRSPTVSLWLAICLLATAMYGFAAGCWPLGFIQLAFAGSSSRQWWAGRRTKTNAPVSRVVHREWYECESRISRMFGQT